MPLIIVQCSGAKIDGSQSAMTKYRSRFHNTVREFMLGGGYAAGWDWSILSAKHGLVHPTSSLDDYDALLASDAQVAVFVEVHSTQIRSEIESNEAADAILFVGSKRYFQALCAALPDRHIKHIGAGGRGCGDYFSALQAGFSLYDENA
jgi:hypothetical protein